jgi:hypothetical protein
MFAGGFHVSLDQPPVNAALATIESTVALPYGPRQLLIAGARRVSAPSRPDSNRAEADAAKTAFLQAFQRPIYPDRRFAGRENSGKSLQIRGAASLADVPYWRKPKNRLTKVILPCQSVFLKLKQ